ncbi:MAG TPA: hypothetical protein VL306_00715 [Methylomirabilota bacterium]|jgi:hypothetical protein|nr:hypothetical protein [Methylomirabilota bacterium]
MPQYAPALARLVQAVLTAADGYRNLPPQVSFIQRRMHDPKPIHEPPFLYEAMVLQEQVLGAKNCSGKPDEDECLVAFELLVKQILDEATELMKENVLPSYFEEALALILEHQPVNFRIWFLKDQRLKGWNQILQYDIQRAGEHIYSLPAQA